MKGNPGDLSSRWLLNLAHMTLGEYPLRVPRQWLLPPAIFDSDYRIERFQDVAPQVGLDLLGLAGGKHHGGFRRRWRSRYHGFVVWLQGSTTLFPEQW